MKHIETITLLLLMTLLCGCGSDETCHGRFYDEVLAGVMESNPDISKLSFYDFAVTDSVTFAQQMDADRKLFHTKKDRLAATAEQYRLQKKKKNAAVWDAKAAHTDSIIVRIDSLFNALQNNGEDILYYSCRFSGNGKRKNGSLVIFDSWYATVSPDGRVFNIINDSSKVRQGMGTAFPGYTDIIGK